MILALLSGAVLMLAVVVFVVRQSRADAREAAEFAAWVTAPALGGDRPPTGSPRSPQVAAAVVHNGRAEQLRAAEAAARVEARLTAGGGSR